MLAYYNRKKKGFVNRPQGIVQRKCKCTKKKLTIHGHERTPAMASQFCIRGLFVYYDKERILAQLLWLAFVFQRKLMTRFFDDYSSIHGHTCVCDQEIQSVCLNYYDLSIILMTKIYLLILDYRQYSCERSMLKGRAGSMKWSQVAKVK